MCECVLKIKERLLKDYEFKPGHKTIHVSYPDDFNLVLNEAGELINTSISTFRADVEGFKRKFKTGVMHTYCPFCGEKYKEKIDGVDDE